VSAWRRLLRARGAAARSGLLLVGCIALAAPLAAAPSYDLSWWTVDGGGGSSAGGDLALQGTLGQPDAGPSNSGLYALQGGFWAATLPQGSAGRYHSLTPCRVLDTRIAGEPLPTEIAFSLPLRGVCGVPPDAFAVAVNVTVVDPDSAGYLQLYAADLGPVATAALTFAKGAVRTNNAVAAIAVSSGALAVRPVLAPLGTTHVVVDVFGYFG
jgi:hypothetical protein